MQNPNISRLLMQAKNVQQSDSENWTCYCPVHEGDGDGHANSLSVSAGNDGKILVNCHAGCNSKDVVYAFGLTWGDCFPPKNDTPGSRITATYDYVDADGILRFQVCRIEPGKDGRAKDFRQRQPDGVGGWSWKTKGIAKFPYRLRELSEDKSQPVYIVEGEKQVDYLRSLGLIATTNPGGAGKWLKSYAKYFADRDCIVIPDADLPNEKTGKIVGAEHAQQVADSLIGIASKIRVVELPNCKPKWGLDDWLQKGGNTLEELGRIVSRVAQWGPDSTLTTKIEKPAEPEDRDPLQRYRDILADCGIIYAAQHDRGDVEIFSEITQKFTTWGASRLGSLKHEDLMLACGHIIDLKVKISAEDDTANWTVKQVRSAIAIVASATPAVEEKRGIGVWEDKGCIIVATSRRLAILNGTPKMQISSNPVQLGTAYDIGDRCDWVDVERVRDDILSVDAQPGKLHVADVLALEEIFSKWSYTVPDSVFPQILAGLVLATFVQTMWTWRPQIFLTGQPYCGKSTMFQVLRRVMGPLCASSSSSSAAGLRQYIGSSGRVAMVDELEKSQHRKDITDMIRMAGRGDDSFRGSQSNTGHIKHHLQHIFWAAATESGLSKEADTSRFIVIDIRKVDDRIELPAHDELHAMGQRLIGTAICNAREARRVGELLMANKPEGSHGRVCESYSVPVAMYAASIGLSDSDAISLFTMAIESISEANAVESDADRILSEILSANVQITGGRLSIAQMIESFKYEELEAYGIYIEFGADVAYFHCPAVVRHLVPDYRGSLIEDILCRLPGAAKLGRGRRVKGRQWRRMVEIPLEILRPVTVTAANPGEHTSDDLFV